MNEFLEVLPILILSGGLVIVSLNCYWLCKLITKLSWRVHELEMAARYPLTRSKTLYQQVKDDAAAAAQAHQKEITEHQKRLWSGES